MTSKIILFEKMAREILEKQDELIQAPNAFGCCDLCAQHKILLHRSSYQTTSLLRGLIAYLEDIKQDRREKRRRYNQNKNMKKLNSH